jgi:protein-S-isoprenylcysteine O-methyltransferase Ste14
MALSVIFGAVGLSLYLRSPPGLVVSASVALILHLWVTRIEEPGLIRRFGETYVAYSREVPRWLPGTPARAAG